MGILICVFSVAVFMDLKSYRIPNLCILIGMAAGLVMTFINSSWEGIWIVIVTMGVIFFIFYPFYLLGGLGAGDIKLFMMVSCYMRDRSLVHYIMVTMLIAALVSIVKMVIYRQNRKRILYFFGYMRKLLLFGTADEYKVDRDDKCSLIRMSLPAFASLVLKCAGVYG